MNTDEARARYLKAAHAMQTGVAMEMNYDPQPTTPKHLRVGVNSAMSDQGGLVTLLIAKGIITEEEYLEAICASMEREAESYTQRIRAHLGPDAPDITLG